MKQGKKGRKRVFFSPESMRDWGMCRATPEQRLDLLITAVGLPMYRALLCSQRGRADGL